MKIQSSNPTIAKILGFIFNIPKHEAKFPFELVRYNPELSELEFYQYALARFQEHSDGVVRELEEVIKECQEESLQKDK